MCSLKSLVALASLAVGSACHGAESSSSADTSDATSDVRLHIPDGAAALDAAASESGGSDACSTDDVAVRTFDAACPVILASDYDQTCVEDSDCIGVGGGSVCAGCFGCPISAINRRDGCRFQADLAAAIVGIDGGWPGGIVQCSCPEWSGACCREGRCSADCCLGHPTCLEADGGGR